MGWRQPMCGAVTFCQRFGSLLDLDCHFHSVIPDGVFVRNWTPIAEVRLNPEHGQKSAAS
jgi:hypothetical protein